METLAAPLMFLIVVGVPWGLFNDADTMILCAGLCRSFARWRVVLESQGVCKKDVIKLVDCGVSRG